MDKVLFESKAWQIVESEGMIFVVNKRFDSEGRFEASTEVTADMVETFEIKGVKVPKYIRAELSGIFAQIEEAAQELVQVEEMEIEEMVKTVDPVNAEYILSDRYFESKVDTRNRFIEEGETGIVKMIYGELVKMAQEFDQKEIVPSNAKVGDGVTMHLYSDSHAGTVVKVTKTTITVQRDDAKLDPNWKPEIIAGGFAGHCTNQHTQKYTYERNPKGQTITFTWSKKYNRYVNNKMGRKLSKGRHEFYDYNF